jgi:RNA polymerase sigma-70 factor (ECF subfamily)
VANIDRFTGHDAGLVPWLVGICRHVVADVQRAKHRWGYEEPHDYASDAPGPADQLASREERALVRAAFARLDPDEQELLELRVVAGLSSDEVAAALDKKASAVRMAQMRALGRLRTFIQEADRVV